MDLGLGLFYYTLIVLLAVILTAATCLASYLVTRNKTYRYAFAGFLFYFFDVALVFQDDFLMQRASDASVSPFFIGSPVASVLVGGGALISFWLVLCEYLEEDRPAVRWIPGAAFVLTSFAVLLLAPEGNGQMFLFYSMREAMLYAMLVYLAARYIGTRDDVLRLRMRRHRALYGALWALVTCVLLENVVFLLVVDPHAIAGQRLPFFPERNFAENALVCAAASPPARARGAACRYDAPNRPRREAHRSRRSSTRISQPTRPRDSCRSARPRCCDSCCWARTTRTSPHPCILRRAPSRCTCTISSRRPSGLTARSLSRIFGNSPRRFARAVRIRPARSYCR